MSKTIKLGDKVKDKITGLTGIATQIAECLHGCRRVTVEPDKLKDGSPLDGWWIDEYRLTVIKSGVIKPYNEWDEPALKPGGPPTRIKR